MIKKTVIIEILCWLFLFSFSHCSGISGVCYEVIGENVYIDVYSVESLSNFPNGRPEKGGIVLDNVVYEFTEFVDLEKEDYYSFELNTGCFACKRKEHFLSKYRAIVKDLKNGWHEFSSANLSPYDSLECHESNQPKKIFIDGVNNEFLCEDNFNLSEMKCPDEVKVPAVNKNCEAKIPNFSTKINWDSCMPNFKTYIPENQLFMEQIDVEVVGFDIFYNNNGCVVKVKQEGGFLDLSELKPNKSNLWPVNNEMQEIKFSGIQTYCEENMEYTCSLNVVCNSSNKDEEDTCTQEDYEITGDLSLKLKASKENREYIIKVICSSNYTTENKFISIFVKKDH